MPGAPEGETALQLLVQLVTSVILPGQRSHDSLPAVCRITAGPQSPSVQALLDTGASQAFLLCREVDHLHIMLIHDVGWAHVP